MIENVIKECLAIQQSQPKDKIILHQPLGKQWKVIGADIFKIDDKDLLCIVDYISKFPIVK